MTPQDASGALAEMARAAPVIPVIVVESAETAPDLAQALVAGGLTTIEVTLRTPAALDAIAAMSAIPGANVGAGTVLTAKDARRSAEAGARFAVSPGGTEAVCAACEELGLPLLPGAVTATEAMRLADRGYDFLKFFPAEASGGARAIRDFAGPLPRIRFCPTGGVTLQNAPDYLAQPNILCVGGTWIAPKDRIAAQDWPAISALAAEAAALRA